MQRNLRGILEKLPKTLDETYERVLKDINEDNREHARRLLHCLAVATRPLRVEELAEILAFDFDDVEGGIPKFHPDWQWEDPEEAVLSTCSSLIAIVDYRNWRGDVSRVVQFSHFSVKEFLISDRLASSTSDISRHYILSGPAHTIFAQVCLGFFLYLGDCTDWEGYDDFPLADYAAQKWVEHARFEDVASHVRDGIRSLFDPDEQHLKAWLGFFEIDPYQCVQWGLIPVPDTPNPLYYAMFTELPGLVEHIVTNHPQLVNATHGQFCSPLIAALSGGDIQNAEFLLRHGGNVDVRGTDGQTPLHWAIAHEDVHAVSFLLEHGADVNSQSDNLWTPLHLASSHQILEVVPILLEHGADIDSRTDKGEIPLSLVFKDDYCSEDEVLPFVQFLLDHGTNVNAQDKDHKTPLLLAMKRLWHKIFRVLLEHGADPNVKDNHGRISLHVLFDEEYDHIDEVNTLEFVRSLLEHGVDINTQDGHHKAPLHLAIQYARYNLVRVFLKHDADPDMKTDGGQTPLHLALENEYGLGGPKENIFGASLSTHLLLEHGADVNAQDDDQTTPLLLAIRQKMYDIARVLLVRGAEPNVKNWEGKTQLHLLLEGDFVDDDDIPGLVRLLLERGADVSTLVQNYARPLFVAAERVMPVVANPHILNHSVGQSAKKEGGTLLDLVSNHPLRPKIAQIILDHAAADKDRVPLHMTLEGEYIS